MNVAIACGGTGGHLFPGLAVAEVLRDRGHRVLIFISEKEIDALAVRDHASREGFQIEKLQSVGMPRLLSPAMLRFAGGMWRSLAACQRFYRKFRPNAVLGMGGFTSTAPILAGRLARVSTFVHESNAIPGKANRLNARLVQAVLIGFAECAKGFPRGTRCETTGTPLRASLLAPTTREAALRSFGWEAGTDGAERRTLLVIGGSQGAHGINKAVQAALPAWRGQAMRVIHITGRDDEAAVRAAYAGNGLEAFVAPFCHEMQNAYAAADLAIARSGAASLSELAHFRVPALLIPYPFAAEDHQTLNAQIFTRAGAALMLNEGELTGDTLGKLVPELLLRSDEKLGAMAAMMGTLAVPNAAQNVADTIERLAKSVAQTPSLVSSSVG